jgi:hypothetical protein
VVAKVAVKAVAKVAVAKAVAKVAVKAVAKVAAIPVAVSKEQAPY